MGTRKFYNYLLGKQFSFTILTDHEALIGALDDNKYTKTAQSRLYRWADKFLQYEFTIKHLPGQEKGFVFASVNYISLILGFDKLLPRCSHSQINDKFSPQTVSHDFEYSNVIGQSTNDMTRQEFEREKLISKATEVLQTLFMHSQMSVCQNFHSQTEDSIPSCKPINFSNK